MPKQKTKKSLTRRFKITKSGKVLRRQGFKRHLNASKSRKKKRALSRVVEVDKSHAKKIKKVLGKHKPVRNRQTNKNASKVNKNNNKNNQSSSINH